MRLFGRRETLNEQLLREAGVAVEPVPAPAPEPELGGRLGIPGIRGGPYLPQADDAVVTLDADVLGDAIQFVSLPDGSLLVDGAAHAPVPSLDAIAEDEDFAVQAERLDGDRWELQVSAL